MNIFKFKSSNSFILLQACPAGTYNNRTRRSTCDNCEAGYYCLANTVSYLEYPCPKGSFIFVLLIITIQKFLYSFIF